MFDTGWYPEKEREPRCKAEKLPTNGPMKTRRGMGSVFCFLFQENFRDVYIIICQREPGARCMYDMNIALHNGRPLWLKRPLRGKQPRDARNASLGSAVPALRYHQSEISRTRIHLFTGYQP